jgi:hypothetical protein
MYAASITAVVYFIYKMALLSKLPAYPLNIPNNIAIPNMIKNYLKPTVEKATNTWNELMNIPVAPLTLITGVGVIFTTIDILKVALWGRKKT